MKKLLFILCLTLLSITMQAQTQHMKFAGIPLTGTIDQFQKKLVAKGYRLKSEVNRILSVGTRAFLGTFAGKKGNIAVYYDAKTKIVYGAKVYYDDLTEQMAKDELENMKALLKNKYGEEYSEVDKDKQGNPTFSVDTGLGSIYCYLQENESYLGFPYDWSAHAEFMDAVNLQKHNSSISDDF